LGGHGRLLERDFVGKAVVAGEPRRLLLRRPLLALRATLATAVTASAQHLHFAGDDVRRVAFDALLVGVLVGAQRALDVDLGTLAQVFASDLGQAAEELHTMPLRAFLLLAGLFVRPGLAGGHADGGHGRTRGRVARI